MTGQLYEERKTQNTQRNANPRHDFVSVQHDTVSVWTDMGEAGGWDGLTVVPGVKVGL